MSANEKAPQSGAFSPIVFLEGEPLQNVGADTRT